MSSLPRSLVSITILALICVSLSSSIGLSESENAELNSIESRFFETYRELIMAEKRGADITFAIMKLREVLYLIPQAEKTGEPNKTRIEMEIITLLGEIEQSIPSLIIEGEKRILQRTIINVVSASTITASAILLYLQGPKAFWRLWLRSRKEWKVKRT